MCDVKTLLCKYSKKKCLSCSWVLSLSLCWSPLYDNKKKCLKSFTQKKNKNGLHGVSEYPEQSRNI